MHELNDGMKIVFHDSYSQSINLPCQEVFDKRCKYCDDEELRTRDLFLWSVWDYDSKEVKILMAAINNCTPVPALIGMSDAYNTIMDRDFEITKNGSQTTTTFQVIPLDKADFKNKKARPFTQEKLLVMVNKAFPDDNADPDDDADDDDDDATESKKKKPASKASKRPVKKARKAVDDEDEDEDEEEEEEEEEPVKAKPKSKKSKPKPVVDEDDDDEDADDDEDEGSDNDYSGMSAKTLYQECKDRGLKVKSKMKATTYLEALEKDDAKDDSDDEDDDDEWEE